MTIESQNESLPKLALYGAACPLMVASYRAFALRMPLRQHRAALFQQQLLELFHCPTPLFGFLAKKTHQSLRNGKSRWRGLRWIADDLCFGFAPTRTRLAKTPSLHIFLVWSRNLRRPSFVFDQCSACVSSVCLKFTHPQQILLPLSATILGHRRSILLKGNRLQKLLIGFQNRPCPRGLAATPPLRALPFYYEKPLLEPVPSPSPVGRIQAKRPSASPYPSRKQS